MNIRCPNCSASRADEDVSCGECGWVPLRSTELLFLDGHAVRCPACSRERNATDDHCPYCGSRAVLAPLSAHVTNFHTSTLLLFATLIALCFALLRLAIPAGILAFLLVGLSSIRTCVLAQERKRHRYPHSLRDLARMFGSSAIGVIVGSLVLLIASGVLYLFAGAIFAAVQSTRLNIWHAIILAVPAPLSCWLGFAAMVGANKERRKMCALGFGATAVPGLVAAFICLTMSRRLGFLIPGLLPLGIVTAAIALACRRGGAARARSFLVGTASGFCLLQLLTLFTGTPVFEMTVEFGALAILLWPALLTVMTLENMWSWDDSFPRIRLREPAAYHPLSKAVLIIEDGNANAPSSPDHP